MSVKFGATLLSGVCVSINIMMGSGYLSLPEVFYKAGPVFSFGSIILVGSIMYITCCWEGRAACRASYKLSTPVVCEITEALRMFCGEATSLSYVFILSASFAGVVWAYAIMFAESLSSSLPMLFPGVECVNGFLGSFACYARYLFNLSLFGLFSTPLALMDVSDQAYFQLCITVLTVMLVSLMVGTATHAFVVDQMAYCFPNSFLVLDQDATTAAADVDNFVSFKDAFCCLSSCVFSIYLNGSVVIVASSLADKSGGRLERMFAFAIGSCCVMYFALYTLTVCFGSHIDPLANLNWRGFRFPTDSATAAAVVAMGADGIESVPGSAAAGMVEMFVVLFPALVVLSVYPLSTKVIANLLLEAFHGSELDVNSETGSVTEMSTDDASERDQAYGSIASFVDDIEAKTAVDSEAEYYNSYQQQVEFVPLLKSTLKPGSDIVDPQSVGVSAFHETLVRVGVNIAPIVGAALVPNVETIVVFVGGVSVVVGLIYPAVLSLASRKAMMSSTVAPNTHVKYNASASADLFLPPMDDWKEGSSTVLQWGSLIFGSVLAVMILATPWM